MGSVNRFFSQVWAVECVSAFQGHPGSLILVPVKSAYVTSY